MTNLQITLLECAAATAFLALYDYHFSLATNHMQFQWWSPFIPLIAPLLRSLWQTLALTIGVVTLILVVGKP